MRDLTIIRKNLFRKKLRLTLLLISIFVAFFLYGTLVTVKTAIEFGGGELPSNRLIVANKVNFTQPLPLSYIESVRTVDGVKWATPSSWFGGYYQEPRNFVIAYATDFASYFEVFPEFSLPQRDRDACLAQRTGLLVGRSLASQYGWRTGQSITLLSNIYQHSNGGQAWDFTICGIYSDTSGQGGDIVALMHYEYFNGTRTFAQDKISLVTLKLEDGADANGVRRAIDRRFANSPFETDTVTEQQFAAAFAAQFGDIGLIVTLVVGAAFISIIMIVGSTMLIAAMERTRELAILKTLGFPVSRLLRLVVSEAVMIALLGGVSGLFAAQLLTWLVSRSGSLGAFEMTSRTWLSGLFLDLLLGLVVSAVPTYRALNLNIVTALSRR